MFWNHEYGLIFQWRDVDLNFSSHFFVLLIEQFWVLHIEDLHFQGRKFQQFINSLFLVRPQKVSSSRAEWPALQSKKRWFN